MRYNEKYDRYVDDDLVIYRWDKNKDKLVQCKIGSDGGGYKNLATSKGKILLHRLIWETFVGEIPQGYQIDHINTIKTDNRLDNLRCVTPKENMNNPLTRKHSSDAIKGKPASNKGKPWSEFGKKFKEHFGITNYENPTLYAKEKHWFYAHGHKCRWEKE